MIMIRFAMITTLFLATAAANGQTILPEVKTLLDSAKAHQKDEHYISFLMQAETAAANDVYSDATVKQRIGNYYYARQPQKSAEYQYAAHDRYKKGGYDKQAAMCLHSLGFIYEEQLNDIPKAISFIEAAVQMHTAMKDTLELANMQKYVGMLYGRAGRYTEGKISIQQAIRNYKAKDNKPGIAVSWFDMAKVYTLQGKYDSSLYFLLKARNYWVEAGDKGRLFNINNELVLAYLNAGKHNDAHNSLQQNEDMVHRETIYFADKLNYYKAGYRYYMTKNNTAKAQGYLQQQRVLRDSLEAKGIKVN